MEAPCRITAQPKVSLMKTFLTLFVFLSAFALVIGLRASDPSDE